jgi:hypothetical protein
MSYVWCKASLAAPTVALKEFTEHKSVMEDIEDFVDFSLTRRSKCREDNPDLVLGKKPSTGEFATSYKT